MKPYKKSHIPCYVICNRCGEVILDDDQVKIDHTETHHKIDLDKMKHDGSLHKTIQEIVKS